jgi:hypothetical protein
MFGIAYPTRSGCGECNSGKRLGFLEDYDRMIADVKER